MMRIELTGKCARAAVRLGLFGLFMAAAGCGDPVPTDKKDDAALKASMQKSIEIYKSKTPAIKGNPAAGKRGS